MKHKRGLLKLNLNLKSLLKIERCIKEILELKNRFFENFNLKFKVKFTRTNNKLIFVKSFLNIFRFFFFAKSFLKTLRFLLICFSNDSGRTKNFWLFNPYVVVTKVSVLKTLLLTWTSSITFDINGRLTRCF